MNSLCLAFFAFAGTIAATTHKASEREQDEHGLHSARVDRAAPWPAPKAQLAPGAVCEDGFAHLRSHESALLQMGMSVPNAVVVNAMAMATDSSSLKQAAGEMHEEERQDDGYAPGCQPALAWLR